MGDPLRGLIYAAAERAVCGVFADGVRGVGGALSVDRRGAEARLQRARQRMLAEMARHELAGPQRRGNRAPEPAGRAMANIEERLPCLA